MRDYCNQPKPLSGIETFTSIIWQLTEKIAINLNPYQGLKRSDRALAALPQRDCNQPKPLSGIETAIVLFVELRSNIAINLNLSGIETNRGARILKTRQTIAINLNPYQGLKRAGILQAQLNPDDCNQPKPLSGIETKNPDKWLLLLDCNQPKPLSGIETCHFY